MISIVSDFATEVSQVLEIIQACRKVNSEDMGARLGSSYSRSRRTEFTFAIFLSSSSKVRRGNSSLIAVDVTRRSLFCV